MVRAVHRAAFTRGPTPDGRPAGDGTAEARLVDELRADHDLVPECCLVVERDGELVGHVAVSRSTLDGQDVGLVGLGPIGVLPRCQRDGVGSALMHATIAAADAIGLRAVVLLGHPTYYPRFGFGPAVDSGVRPPEDWGPEYFMLRRLAAWGDGVRGRFRYAAAFERMG
jgi:putative acetyltransferase